MRSSRLNLRKGVSTLLLSTLIIAVLLTSIAAVYMQVSALRRSITSGAYSLVQYGELHDLTRLAVIQGEDYGLEVTNIGSLPIELQYVVIDEGYGIKIVEVSSLPSSCGKTFLKQGQVCSYFGLTGRVIALITSTGIIVRPEYIGVKGEIVSATYMSLISFEGIYTPENLSRLFNIPNELIDLPLTGGQGTRYVGMRGDKLFLITRNDIHSNVEVVTGRKSGNVFNVAPIGFGVMLIGYDPAWLKQPYGAPQYVIMLTIPKNVPQENYLAVGGQKLSDYGSRDIRVIIRGFRGVIRIYNDSTLIACTGGSCTKNVVGGWYYGYRSSSSDPSPILKVELNGLATQVLTFKRIASGEGGTQATTYYPYLFIGDLDGNGVNEIVFVTEDAYYGGITQYNDRNPLDPKTTLLDYSEVPLPLTFNLSNITGSTDGSIPGSRFSGLMIYMNLIFHDNSYPDGDAQLSDNDETKTLLRILLVQKDDAGNIVSKYIVREYDYQEICNYHKTIIKDFINDNYFVKIPQSIYVSISGSGKYWLLVEIMDPYSITETRMKKMNDVDFTIGFEIIAILPLSR
ncbi:MAG: hypothetical protein QN229_03345 [Desulfurococcaceae archaeon TW002]